MKTPQWVTSSGERVALAQMSDAHVQAVMRYLTTGDGEYGRMERPGCSGFSNAEWVQLCAAELLRRARHGLA